MNKIVNLIQTITFWFEFTVGYMLTSTQNLPFYHRMMYETYGTRYCSPEQFQHYWDQIAHLDQS